MTKQQSVPTWGMIQQKGKLHAVREKNSWNNSFERERDELSNTSARPPSAGAQTARRQVREKGSVSGRCRRDTRGSRMTESACVLIPTGSILPCDKVSTIPSWDIEDNKIQEMYITHHGVLLIHSRS